MSSDFPSSFSRAFDLVFHADLAPFQSPLIFLVLNPVSFQVSGVPIELHPTFYRGLAITLATKHCQALTEVVRLGG